MKNYLRSDKLIVYFLAIPTILSIGLSIEVLSAEAIPKQEVPTVKPTTEILPEVKQTLIKAAVNVRKGAYAPYSKFLVGAAILGESGKIYSGCNVENASFPMTACAERVAVFSAIKEGERKFQALALCIKGHGCPCGACLQVLSEFATDLPIFLCDENGNTFETTNLSLLYPQKRMEHHVK